MARCTTIGFGGQGLSGPNTNDSHIQTLSWDDEGNLCISSANCIPVQIDGTVVGNTLIVTQPGGGTRNIPLIGQGSQIDFSTLTPAQRQAIADAIKGPALLSVDGTILGYLLD